VLAKRRGNDSNDSKSLRTGNRKGKAPRLLCNIPLPKTYFELGVAVKKKTCAAAGQIGGKHTELCVRESKGTVGNVGDRIHFLRTDGREKRERAGQAELGILFHAPNKRGDTKNPALSYAIGEGRRKKEKVLC